VAVVAQRERHTRHEDLRRVHGRFAGLARVRDVLEFIEHTLEQELGLGRRAVSLTAKGILEQESRLTSSR